MLRTLLENLFRNVVGHGGSDVTVRVSLFDGGFLVEDTGSGIPKDMREKVLEHGFSTGYSGSGFGLTIISRIADAHGGTRESCTGERSIHGYCDRSIQTPRHLNLLTRQCRYHSDRFNTSKHSGQR